MRLLGVASRVLSGSHIYKKGKKSKTEQVGDDQRSGRPPKKGFYHLWLAEIADD
jgi:hypothetical protein